MTSCFAFRRGRRSLAAVGMAAACIAPSRAFAQLCPEGAPVSATIGIGAYQCITSHGCSISADQHEFGTEPSILKIDPSGPAAGLLKDGDVLVAVDGRLITTRAGGARIAKLSAGVPITLRIRRNGQEADVRVTPVRGCDTASLTVLSPKEDGRSVSGDVSEGRMGVGIHDDVMSVAKRMARGTSAPAALARVEFGMDLDCGECGWQMRDGALVFRTARPVVVLRVEPGGPAARAGLAGDDLILEVNRLPITDDRAARLMGTLESGQSIELTVWRRGETKTMRVAPRAADTRPREDHF